MKAQTKLVCTSIAFALAMAVHSPATALTMKECSAKYKEAQSAGTLQGMKWKDFRKAQCGADASPAASTSTPDSTAAPTTARRTTRATSGSAPAAYSTAVFPNAVSPKYSKETPGHARMHTCVDQYNANKAANANGKLKWIEKGGGYWSECNKRLKG